MSFKSHTNRKLKDVGESSKIMERENVVINLSNNSIAKLHDVLIMPGTEINLLFMQVLR
jgi:hypothetical protein